MEKAPEISHLSDLQIEELYEKYLEGRKNSDLMEEYSINARPNMLIGLLPPIELSELCDYCDLPLFKKRKSKSSYSSEPSYGQCAQCEHRFYFDQKAGYTYKVCECTMCKEIREEEERLAKLEVREMISQLYDISDRDSISYGRLTFFHKLSLLALIRIQTDEDFLHIQSLDDPLKTIQLCPTRKMDIDSIQRLFDDRVVLVSPDSQISAFVEEKDYNSFYMTKVDWVLNISLEDQERLSLPDLHSLLYMDIVSTIKEDWKTDLFQLIYELACEEVIQYLEVKSDELNLAVTAENKSREVIKELLNNFSVSEIYYFAKKAIENAHIFYAKGHSHGKKHATNTIPKKMLELGERAINESWNTYQYSRDSRAPRCEFSKVLFDLILEDEDAGFLESPGKYWEEQLRPGYFSDSKDGEITHSQLVCTDCGSIKVLPTMTANHVQIECADCGATQDFKKE